MIRNAPTSLMKELGYGKGYAYAHDDPAGAAAQQHLPDELVGRTFFPRRPKAKAPAVPGPKPPETPAE